MFTSTCILMLNNGMPPHVAGNRLSSSLCDPESGCLPEWQNRCPQNVPGD